MSKLADGGEYFGFVPSALGGIAIGHTSIDIKNDNQTTAEVGKHTPAHLTSAALIPLPDLPPADAS